MTLYTHRPALITTLAAGATLANAATTPAAAGSVMTAATSTGGTITWQTDRWRCVGNAGAARLDEPITAAGVVTVDDLWNIPAIPTGAANRLYEFRHASNYVCRVEQNIATGTLVVADSTNAAIWTSAAIPVGEVRISVTVDPATVTTGAFTIRIYTTNPRTSTTPDQTWTSSTVNLGAADVVAVRRGRISSTASSTATVELVYSQTQDTSAVIGPLVVATPPTAVVTSSGPFMRYDARGSTLGTSASLTYDVAHISGPVGTPIESADGLFYLPQASTAAVYRITATGADGTDTEDVTVPAITTSSPSPGIRRRVRVGGVFI